MTPVFRLSFPSLFQPSKPRNAKPEQEAKYSCAMLFAKGENLDKLKKAAADAAREKWGDNIPKELKTPFRDQGAKEYDGYEDGAIFITATSKQRPGIVNQRVEPIIDESEMYPGCYCQATVRAFAYGGGQTGFSPGIAFGLQNIQKVKDGDSLAGRSKPEDEFQPLDGAAAGGESASTTDDIFK